MSCSGISPREAAAGTQSAPRSATGDPPSNLPASSPAESFDLGEAGLLRGGYVGGSAPWSSVVTPCWRDGPLGYKSATPTSQICGAHPRAGQERVRLFRREQDQHGTAPIGIDHLDTKPYACDRLLQTRSRQREEASLGRKERPLRDRGPRRHCSRCGATMRLARIFALPLCTPPLATQTQDVAVWCICGRTDSDIGYHGQWVGRALPSFF